jgi:hypothetical protein
MTKALLIVSVLVLGACSSSSDPPKTTTDSGGTGGGDDTTPAGDGCSGTYSGAVTGTLSCADPLLVDKDLGMTATLSGSDVNATHAISIKGKATLEAKTYAMTDLDSINTQIIGADGKHTWGLHYDSTSSDPPDPKWTASFVLTSLSPAHGTIDLTLVEETDGSTVTEHVKF